MNVDNRMDDADRVANIDEMADLGAANGDVVVASTDTVDDDIVINDACVKSEPLNFENTNKQENTDFSVKTWKEDLTLLVENKKLYVSKTILGLVSPVFDRMFQSEFREGNQTEIDLPDKKLDDVKEFLRCIYPNMENDVSEKNVYIILPLADEYQVTALKTKCEGLLKKSLQPNSSVCEIYKVLNIASRYNIMQLMEEGLELASRKSLGELESAEYTVPISPETKSIIHRKVMEYLQQEVDNLKVELQTVKTLNNFHRASLPKMEQLNAKDFSEWEGVSRSFTLDLESMTPKHFLSRETGQCEVTVNICGVYLTCIFEVGYGRDLSVSTKLADMSEVKTISLIMKVVLIKALKNERDFYKIFKENISRRSTSTSRKLITLNH